jgi:sterol desaturase/sphingolipid hydroxylase (fatty acid hydroxylase superfamily)
MFERSGVIQAVMAVLFALFALLPFGAWVHEHRLWTVPMDTWWGWAALFFSAEFLHYWMHRAGHRVRWFWASHQVHHSLNQHNLSAAFRQPIDGMLICGFVFIAPLCLLGFSPESAILALAWKVAYQFWLHTEAVPRLGWLEGILNTPSAHRVHHAANVEYLDCNLGGVTVLFDRVFGTYAPEREGAPIRYGLVRQPVSCSARRVFLSEWGSIWRDLRAARHPLHALGYLFGPPGWAPDGRGLTTEALRERMRALTGRAVGVPPEWLLEGHSGPRVEVVSSVVPLSRRRQPSADVEDVPVRRRA